MPPRSYRFGPFYVDRAEYRVLRESQSVPLTPKLLDVLLHLLDHAGHLVTKEALLEAVWPGANVTDNALAQAVSELRQALGDDSGSPHFIKTVARRGYRFIAPVEPIDEAQVSPSVDRGSSKGSDRSTAAPLSQAEERTVAVLDFTNVTGESEVAWLSAGIAETVTGDLRSLGDFRVIDRRRVLEAARRTDGSLNAITADVGARLAIVGSYQRSGNRIRITARLVDVPNGETLADAKVDGPIETIFQLQDEIVLSFARDLGVAVHHSRGSRIGARETPSLEAYRAFTEGWLRLETLDVAELEKAADDFRRAIALDHRYALAHTGLASAEFARFETTRSDSEPEQDRLERAIEYARHAVALDDGLAEAHATLALLLVSAWQTEEAAAEARRAIALEPSNWRQQFRLGHASWGEARLRAAERTLAQYPAFAFAYFQMAMVHVARGHLVEAETVLRRGTSVQDRQRDQRERFPALGLHWLLGLTRLAAGDAEEALIEFDRELAVADIGRLYGREYAMHAHYGRGLALLHTNRFKQAIGELGRALDLYADHAQTHLALGLAHRALGAHDASVRELARVDATLGILSRTKPADAAMVRAMCFAADARLDDALATLEQMLAGLPPGFAGWTIPIEPLLEKLHGHQRFAAVLRSLADRAR